MTGSCSALSCLALHWSCPAMTRHDSLCLAFSSRDMPCLASPRPFWIFPCLFVTRLTLASSSLASSSLALALALALALLLLFLFRRVLSYLALSGPRRCLALFHLVLDCSVLFWPSHSCLQSRLVSLLDDLGEVLGNVVGVGGEVIGNGDEPVVEVGSLSQTRVASVVFTQDTKQYVYDSRPTSPTSKHNAHVCAPTNPSPIIRDARGVNHSPLTMILHPPPRRQRR